MINSESTAQKVEVKALKYIPKPENFSSRKPKSCIRVHPIQLSLSHFLLNAEVTTASCTFVSKENQMHHNMLWWNAIPQKHCAVVWLEGGKDLRRNSYKPSKYFGLNLQINQLYRRIPMWRLKYINASTTTFLCFSMHPTLHWDCKSSTIYFSLKRKEYVMAGII